MQPLAGILVLAVTAGVFAACRGETDADPIDATADVTGCPQSAGLRGVVFGGIEADIDWRGRDLDCEGMPRPDDAGARLRFSGTLPGDPALEVAFIIALPELERGQTVRETPARVTVIEENEGRFFSSADVDVCWSDVTRQQAVAGNRYDIDGIVYCVAPLAEVNGSGEVTFAELSYSGRVDWSET